MNSFSSQETIGLETLTFRGKAKGILFVAKKEYKNTNVSGKAAIAGTLAMIAYEWGPGNETIAPIVAGQALDIANGPEGIAITATVAGGFVAGQQLAGSYLTRKSVRQFPAVSEKAFSYANQEENDGLRFKPFKEISGFKKWIYSFSMGSSFIVSREAIVAGNNEEEKLKKVGRQSSVITGTSVAAIGAGADLINQSFEDSDSVQFVVDNAVKNPLFWLGVMGVTVAAGHFKRKKNLS